MRRRQIRSLLVEALETRALLTGYAYPFGAMPDDTGEFMLGDVAVNVVLLESDSSLAPYDNNAISDPVHPGRGSPVEDWTAAQIAAVKSNIQAGLQWWEDTLANMFPNAPSNLLDFHINWQYTDNPVSTGYEPIDRISNDFQSWIYSFLNQVNFNATGNFSSDVRAYNDFTRQQVGTDWAFTIFVVNNVNDVDKLFASGGSFSQAFSYAGGRFMVVPASRPESTFTHETGHQFWAIDQYSGGGTYTSQRGYYNTQNLNAADNPAPGFVQASSVMSNGTSLSSSFANHTLDPYAMAQIGWQDSDNDGIFDVLDVPFTLSGSGQYNASTQLYSFNGSTHVNTLPNLNPSGTQNDITINQINEIQASIDGGPWQSVKSYAARTYNTNVSVSIPIGTGLHEIRLRSFDTRTGVSSNIFIGETDAPTSAGQGLGGLVFSDQNANGVWNSGESPIPDVGIEVTDQNDQPLDLQHFIEPSASVQGAILNNVHPDATLSAVGPGFGNTDIFARTSTLATSAGKVFTANDRANNVVQAWNISQQFRVDFNTPVSTVSLRAYGATANSVGRLAAYDANDQLIARFTTGALGVGNFTTMNVTRPEGDIKYVIAYGHVGTAVVLDTLQWGPASSATSNTNGLYSLGFLPNGTYRIHISPPSGYIVTTPPSGYATVTVASGQALGAVNFGIAPLSSHPFHNSTNAYNVNNDVQSAISPVDALLVINYLNAHTDAEGEIGQGDLPGLIGYVDVNDDGLCTPVDALLVINYINAHPPGGEGEGAAGGMPSGGSDSGGSGEGEGRIEVPQSAAEYYAQRPLLLSNLPGTDEPCTCSACMAVRSEALSTIASQLATVSGSNSIAKSNLLAGFLSSADTKVAAEASQPRPLLVSTTQLVKLSADWLLSRKPAHGFEDSLKDDLDETLEDLALDVASADIRSDASE